MQFRRLTGFDLSRDGGFLKNHYIAQMKPITSIFRTAAWAGLMILASVWPLAAQEVVAPGTVEELFGKLVQLQEANLGVARQIAETQLRASDALQVVLDEGTVADDALVKLTQTFIDNGRTLASIVLSPIALQNVSAGQSLQRLLRSNIAMLDRVRPQVRANADLSGAFEKYAVLQAQTEDLIVAFDNGWDRYGEVVRTAVLAGMIRAGSFDAVNGIWTLGNPDIKTAAVEAEPDNSQPAVPTPVPALTGNPVLGDAREPETLAETPPLAPDVPIASSSPDSRLDATGPLALAEIKIDGTGRIGDWTIASDGPDLFVASSPNVDARTRDRIASLNIACGENGALYYQVVAPADFGSYAIYSDDSLTRAVRAESNIISGPEAAAMADTLRLGYDWATRDPDKQRRLTVAAVDDDEIPAQFSPSGYMEARGKVLDACVAGIVAQAMGTATRTADSTQQASPTAASADLPRGAVIKPDLVAPSPKTRPSSFKKQGPVDIMAGT